MRIQRSRCSDLMTLLNKADLEWSGSRTWHHDILRACEEWCDISYPSRLT